MEDLLLKEEKYYQNSIKLSLDFWNRQEIGYHTRERHKHYYLFREERTVMSKILLY